MQQMRFWNGNVGSIEDVFQSLNSFRYSPGSIAIGRGWVMAQGRGSAKSHDRVSTN